MKLPFTIEKLVTTQLTFSQIVERLEDRQSIKSFGGLRVDKYRFVVQEDEFYVGRNAYGLDALLEYFPLIVGKVVGQQPTQIHLKLKPDYFFIGFFCVFALIFFIGGALIDDWTLNGVKRAPTLLERLGIISLGCILPLLWCYVQNIRPIKKAESWIEEKLELVDNDGSR